MFVVRPVSSLKDIVTRGVTAFVICSKFLFPVLSISQFYQPTHFRGTQVVGGLNVTVTGAGSSYLISLMSFNSVCIGNTCSHNCCIFYSYTSNTYSGSEAWCPAADFFYFL